MENKRKRILEAGKKIILQDGYGKTKIERITEEVGIAKGSFYNYFESKEKFLLALISEELEERHRVLKKVLSRKISFEECVEELVSYKLDTRKRVLEFELVLYSLLRNLESLTPSIRERLINYDKEALNIIKTTLERYRDELMIENEEDLYRYALLSNTMIKSYKGSKFYADTQSEYFFSSSSEDVTKKIATLEIEKEKKFLTRGIIRLIKGGKK